MKKPKFTNLTVFALFFGLSLLESIQTGNFLRASFWLLIGLIFLMGDFGEIKFLKYKKGLVIGFIVGVLTVPLVLLGLSNPVGLIFYPLLFAPRAITLLLFEESIPVLVAVSVAFYSLMGFLIHYIWDRLRR